MPHQVLPRARLQVVGEGVGVLEGVATPCQQGSSIQQVLPVNPGACASHHLLLDPFSDFGQCLLLQLEGLAMVLPLQSSIN